MPKVETFFRFCPSCGKRFHIKLVSKNLVDDRKEVVEIKRAVMSPIPMGYGKGSMPVAPVIVEENVPITIETEDFQYSYKCKHCGHEWIENHAEQHKVR